MTDNQEKIGKLTVTMIKLNTINASTLFTNVVQIGDCNDTGNNAELEKQALIRYAETWTTRNPNLHLVGAYIHCDEPDGTVHLHCDYIPVAECARGMSVQNSLDKALRQQGLHHNINQTAQMAWQTQERNALMSMSRIKYRRSA